MKNFMVPINILIVLWLSSFRRVFLHVSILNKIRVKTKTLTLPLFLKNEEANDDYSIDK